MRKSFSYYILFPGLYLMVLLINDCKPQTTNKFEAGENWPVYLGGNSSNQYSPLNQINKDNIQDLSVAWEYICGDSLQGDNTQIQCNPLIIDGIMYGTTPRLKLFAVDAATGTKIWEFDANKDYDFAMNVNRGVAYWEKNNDKRILFTSGPDLFAINAETGIPVYSFGDSGIVSLKEGLPARAKELYVVATSPGVIYKNLYIIGSRVSETAGAAPGYIRAFDIITGNLQWVFHTIPKPGEFGYDTWPDSAYKNIGGVNSWTGMSLDEKLGIVYIPTGSAAFDFWGGDRKGQNLFANCVLAINASNGERIWHYQIIHHDLWDYDIPAPPNLVTVLHNGKSRDAIAQITKTGYVFLLDRKTGEPLFQIEEKTVPPSNLEGEEAWPTQPFPVKPPPFSPQKLSEYEVNDISPESHTYITDILKNVRTGQPFIPPSIEGTVIFPGFDGGGEWGGAAFDPIKGILYINSNIMPWILTMVPIEPSEERIAKPGKTLYMTSCAVCHGRDMKGLPGGIYPALVSVTSRLSDDDIIKLLNYGKGFMPSYEYLKIEEKQALIAFLKGEEISGSVDELSGIRTNIIPYTHKGYNRFLDEDGYPAIKPPWGNLSAIDLNEGTILWQVPLGEFPELIKKGIPKTGTENYGGPVVTAGGLIFIAASKDEHIRAFDKDTGEELWKYKLPAGGYATPAVYEVNGIQYIVIACGGGKMGTKSGDKYLAFSLGGRTKLK